MSIVVGHFVLSLLPILLCLPSTSLRWLRKAQTPPRPTTPGFLPFWSSRYEHCAHNTLDPAGDAQHSLNSRCCVLSLLPMIQYLDMFKICLSSISGHIALSCCVFVLSLPPGCSVHCDRDTVSAGDASMASADTISIPPSFSCNCWDLQTSITTHHLVTQMSDASNKYVLLHFRAFCNE